jgi:hypothetical protein
VTVSNLPVERLSRSGISGTLYNAHVDGMSFDNTGTEFLWFYNTSGSSRTLYIAYTAKFDGMPQSPRSYTLTTTGMVFIGPFPPALFNDTAGKVLITFSNHVGVRMSAMQLLAGV